MSASCPKCSGEMVEGRVPFPFNYIFGFKANRQRHFSFETNIQRAYACPECGYLDLYVDPEKLKKKLQ
jgi:DNA-directed RNA polymerase subunit RPC12/RpoP